MSPFAKMYGLELSFLERLMDRLPYQHNKELFAEHGGFDSALVRVTVAFCRCSQIKRGLKLHARLYLNPPPPTHTHK